MSGIVASGLSCIKRDRVLFENLSISVKPGQLVYLRGQNGAGKTSLLRILIGLSEPTSGEVLFNNQPLSKCRTMFHSQLTYIGHKSGLNQNLTALQNLQFWCAQQSLEISQSELFDHLAMIGLVGLEEQPVSMLSAGQQRRVALLRLWLKPSRIWVLDEPFTALDVDGISLLEEQFARQVSEGGAVLLTSHQPLSSASGPISEFVLEYRP